MALAYPNHAGRRRDRDEILSYVNLCFILGRGLGIKVTCLMYSIMLFRMFRQHGIDATIHFGAKKDESDHMIGHCWVVVDGAEMPQDWQIILSRS
jgi:hypothetical protein